MGNAYGVLKIKLTEIYFNLICRDNKGISTFGIKDRCQACHPYKIVRDYSVHISGTKGEY